MPGEFEVHIAAESAAYPPPEALITPIVHPDWRISGVPPSAGHIGIPVGVGEVHLLKGEFKGTADVVLIIPWG